MPIRIRKREEDSEAMELLVLMALTYEIWSGPAAALLNLLLARPLYAAMPLPALLASNLGLTFLLLGPTVSPPGFMGKVFLPWYLALLDTPRYNIPWVGVVMLAAVSLATTIITVFWRRR